MYLPALAQKVLYPLVLAKKVPYPRRAREPLVTTKKAKVASCPGTRQKPSLDARFELFWAPEAPGALFYQIQAQILRPRGRNACDFLPIRLKRPKVVSVSS